MLGVGCPTVATNYNIYASIVQLKQNQHVESKNYKDLCKYLITFVFIYSSKEPHFDTQPRSVD
jgi:hypothetical protein